MNTVHRHKHHSVTVNVFVFRRIKAWVSSSYTRLITRTDSRSDLMKDLCRSENIRSTEGSRFDSPRQNYYSNRGKNKIYLQHVRILYFVTTTLKKRPKPTIC